MEDSYRDKLLLLMEGLQIQHIDKIIDSEPMEFFEALGSLYYQRVLERIRPEFLEKLNN